MTGAAREKDQGDFDLERVIDMFDEAMTSRDPRVIDALRSLMMIVTLTRSETYSSPMADKTHGPLRRLFEDMHHINRRLSDVEHNVRRMERVNERADRFEKEREWPMEQDIYTLKEKLTLAGMNKVSNKKL